MVKFLFACFTTCAASVAPEEVAAAKEEAVQLREGSCTSGFTLSGFTQTRLNGDYIAVYGYPDNSQQPVYHNDRRDEEWDAYPYGIRIDSRGHSEDDKHYIPGKSWSIYYGISQVWDVLLAWCVPGVGGCPEMTESGLWPSSVGAITWNVVDDPNLTPPAGQPSPPTKTTLNSGVSASCCEWTVDRCADECRNSCGQTLSLERYCAWDPLDSVANSCREECCNWVEMHSDYGREYHTCQNQGGASAGYRHCDHSSGLITEASAAAIASSNSSVGSAPSDLLV